MSVALSPLTTLQCTNPALAVTSSTQDGKRKTQLQKNKIYMELTAQRAIPKDAELTLRYTSAFEVSSHSFMEGTYFDNTLTQSISNLVRTLM
jgi:hypothetical protein